MVVIQLGIPKTKSDNSEEKRSLTFESVKSGVLYYYASSVSAEERRWRRVITAEEERHRVGKHRGCMIYVGAVTRMAAILEKIH